MEIKKSLCPFCGYHRIINLEQKIDIKFGFNYLKAISKNKTFQTWHNHAKLVECRKCGTVFPNPKLDKSLVEQIYSIDKSSHDMGWNAIERSQVSNINEHKFFNYLNKFIAREIDLIEKENFERPIKIAEFGCPFSGYAMSTLWASKKKINLKIINKPTSLTGKLSVFLVNLINMFITFTWRLRRKKEKKYFCKRKKINIIFIFEFSPIFWLGNCSRYGRSCLNLASQFLFDKVDSFKNIFTKKEKFDLLIISNSIDHYINAFQIIKDLSMVTNSLLIVGHSDSNFSAQHVFAIDNKTLHWTGKELKKIYQKSDFKVFNFNYKNSKFSGLIVRNMKND